MYVEFGRLPFLFYVNSDVLRSEYKYWTNNSSPIYIMYVDQVNASNYLGSMLALKH